MTSKALRRYALLSASALMLGVATPSMAIELKDAVALGVSSSPEVDQAAQDKQAVEFERKQAQGLWLPRVDLQADAGVDRLDNPTRRLLGLDRHTLWPVEGSLTLSEVVFDGGNRSSELHRQAARTDSAAHHVEERAEYIGLDIVRAYLNYLLQKRLYALAEDNIHFHDQMVGDLAQGVSSGSISIADQQQAEERAQASRSRATQAKEDLLEAAIEFQSRTGVPLDSANMPPDISDKLPASLDDAVALARTNNPQVKVAMADVDAQDAYVGEARSALWPKVSFEATGRAGNDVDGFEGRTTDLGARVVMRWNLYSGGVTQNNIEEQVRRASESRFKLHEVSREVDSNVQSAWNRLSQQNVQLGQLEQESRVSNDLVNSYGEQFKVGRRSLLDLLDSQNTKYNNQVLMETARFAAIFAQYKILAATGSLLDAMGIPHPVDSVADARQTLHTPAPLPAELMERHHP